MKIFSNVLVDLIKILHDNKQTEFDLLSFKTRIGYSTVDKMSIHMKDRIINLLKQSESIEENEIVIYSNLIKKMVDSDFLNRIDISHMRFIIQKEKKFDEKKIDAIFKINNK